LRSDLARGREALAAIELGLGSCERGSFVLVQTKAQPEVESEQAERGAVGDQLVGVVHRHRLE